MFDNSFYIWRRAVAQVVPGFRIRRCVPFIKRFFLTCV